MIKTLSAQCCLLHDLFYIYSVITIKRNLYVMSCYSNVRLDIIGFDIFIFKHFLRNINVDDFNLCSDIDDFVEWYDVFQNNEVSFKRHKIL